MRAHLDVEGKILPPSSPEAARLRHRQVAHEIGRIEERVADPVRRKDGEWLRRAQGALGWLRSEERQLRAWIEARGLEPLPPSAHRWA